jgi:hypothetical protein
MGGNLRVPSDRWKSLFELISDISILIMVLTPKCQRAFERVIRGLEELQEKDRNGSILSSNIQCSLRRLLLVHGLHGLQCYSQNSNCTSRRIVASTAFSINSKRSNDTYSEDRFSVIDDLSKRINYLFL